MGPNWQKLTPDEKREQRFNQWLSPAGIKFISAEAERAYKSRVSRIYDAIRLQKEPDRIPVLVNVGAYPAYYSGTTLHDAMYDYSKLCPAWLKFLREFDFDTFNSPGMALPGKALEILSPKATVWPGYGISKEVTIYQYLEGEYMKADEYDDLFSDPSDFWIRTYMPRVAGIFEPYRKLPTHLFTFGLAAGLLGALIPFTIPVVREMYQKLIDAGKETAEWMNVVREFDSEAMASGFPSLEGGIAFAPFDIIGDFLRGTKGIMTDMYRQPDKLMAALDLITDLQIKKTLAGVNMSGGLIVGFPLHKGDDTFMSLKQYQTFYWPSLKKTIEAFVNEGLIVSLYAEGYYESRLETIKDVPEGAVLWQFEKTDMTKAKNVLGGIACISGNVPASLLYSGTPQDVKEYCRKLIEACGKGGGYILTGEAHMEKAHSADNLHAMIEAVKEYGNY
ncbi:MAG: hypothetical protein JW967_00955 [Dehalococcoidales bacterium]|nr:hypothetical protein [Dehalococcoidales bacterium]